MNAERQNTPECLDNARIAELLAREAETAKDPLQKALRRAARAAFLWEEEAVAMMAKTGRRLTELQGVGPTLEKLIARWLENPPPFQTPPEIRRDFLTLPQARRALASKGHWPIGLQGDLQMHSTWSDGVGTIREMAQAAAQRNYSYIAITDHSKGLSIAGGINEMDLAAQGEEIKALNKELTSDGARLRVLRSVELNLNSRGEGDLEDASLRALDIVLASFHSALRTTEDQTERYLAALRNPAIQILGHPRCRIYDHRIGLKADWRRVFETAAELGKAVEIDGYPDRQDLNVDLLRLAKKARCHISIGTDAHHPWQLRFMEFGLAAAVLAGVKQERILNFMSLDQLRAWVAQARETD